MRYTIKGIQNAEAPATLSLEDSYNVSYLCVTRAYSLGHEETGYPEKKPYSRGDSTTLSINGERSRDPMASAPPVFLEIVSAKWVPDDQGREIVTLTVKDQGRNQDQE